MKNRLLVFFLIIFLITGLLSACSTDDGKSKENNNFEINSEQLKLSGLEYPLTIKDYFGDETVLKEPPKRVAVVSGSLINIWYDLGGKSICTTSIKDGNLKILKESKDEILGLPDVGPVYAVDLEALVAQKPDLVITQAEVQPTIAKQLREMGINAISVGIRSYNDTVDIYKLFGAMLENNDVANKKIGKIKKEKDKIIAKAPKKGKKIAILFLTANLSVKRENSIAGQIAKSLNLENVVKDDTTSKTSNQTSLEKSQLDIEFLVKEDPDILFVTSMVGSNELAVENMKKQFESNAAWQSVRAFREGKIIYLPQEYYLYSAGPYYPEAVKYMASSVYPEIYGNVSEWYHGN